MKPGTRAYLESAGEALSDARKILAIGIPRQAARLAYYAQFHAAQALIFERTDRIAKTHNGVKSQFHKLTRGDTAIPPPPITSSKRQTAKPEPPLR
ncbi:MAG: HEPN domain-containing protein [Rhodomicrobium sp.]